MPSVQKMIIAKKIPFQFKKGSFYIDNILVYPLIKTADRHLRLMS
jgi:hypothetical protein